jgi:putative phage-type endonuclease
MSALTLAEPKRLISTDNLSKETWLKFRQKGIGGSDIASICGVNPYKSALALYYEKTEEIKEDEEENLPAELGTYLEPFLRVKFDKWIRKSESPDIVVGIMSYILQHPENKIALANIDSFMDHPERGRGGVEFKTTSERNWKDWEEDKLPDYYYLQCQWYMYVTGWDYWYIAFLIGNRKFGVKVIKRNEEVINNIVKQANDFWNNFVIPKIPPAPTGDYSSEQTLSKLYPKEKEGKIITLDIKKNLEAIDNFTEQIKTLQGQLDIEKQYIKSLMKDAEVALCGDKKITWKEVIKKEYIVKASKYRMLKISDNHIKNNNEEDLNNGNQY